MKNKDFKILIVEDAKLIAYHLQKLIEDAGYTVIGLATNKNEAISIVDKEKPDIILMDIMLDSDEDGVDAMIEIQRSNDIPVIYLTALTDKQTVDRAKKTHPYGYIMKPFQDEQVVTLLEMALHKFSSEIKLRESERKFKAVVSSISDSFIFVNEEFRVSYMNKAAEKMLECNFEECKDQNFYDVVSLMELENEEKVFNLWNGKSDDISIPLRPMYLCAKSGKRTPIGEGVISKVFDNKEMLNGVVITFRDITDKLKEMDLSEELNKKKLVGIIEGQEKERERISRELHDGLGQVLNGIKLKVVQFQGKPEQQDQLKSLIDEAITETSRISENLLPSKLKNFDLATCLLSLINKDQQDLHITFDTTGINNAKLDINKKINLYRITQELINNCIKHAKAGNLSIQLRGDRKNITLTVEDDGKGFDLTKQKEMLLNGHLGLQNIMDRVKIMDGKIEFDSKKEKGTLVIIDVPYNVS